MVEKTEQKPKPTVGSLEDARKAKEKFKEKFGTFSGVGVGAIDGGDIWKIAVAVRLRRRLTAKEKAKLPLEVDGVPVDYKVVGKIVSQSKAK